MSTSHGVPYDVHLDYYTVQGTKFIPFRWLYANFGADASGTIEQMLNGRRTIICKAERKAKIDKDGAFEGLYPLRAVKGTKESCAELFGLIRERCPEAFHASYD